MRILVLSTVFPNPKQPNLGVFIRERMRLVARHCEVAVISPLPWVPGNRFIRGPLWAGIPPVEDQQGLRVYHPRVFCVPRYLKWLDAAWYAASLLPVLARLRRDFPFDLIDAHFVYPDGLAAVLLGRIFRRPAVITLRGSIVRLATYPLHRPQIAFALRGAARVIAVSDSLKRVAVGLGIAPDRVRVIPNGVDAERFLPRDRQAARRAVGLPADRKILLSVGGINAGKGHHRVVNVLPAVLARHPDLLYVIVGGERPPDSARGLIEDAVRRHGLEGYVRIAGERPHDEIPLWMSAADLFCLATRSEGWANVLLEALGCGTPVVTTRVGGNPEIITSPALGMLVPPGDDRALAAAVVDALERPWRREAMTAYARGHSWDAVGRAVVEEFERALSAAWSGPAPEPVGASRLVKGRR